MPSVKYQAEDYQTASIEDNVILRAFINNEVAEIAEAPNTDDSLESTVDADTIYKTPFYSLYQVGFVPPLNNHGLNSGWAINNLSFNIFSGYAYGLEGVEFASFLNILKKDMTGVQFAGFGNAIGGEVLGFQNAGFFNTALSGTLGWQAAGFLNTSARKFYGIQAAGFLNVHAGKLNGIQASGFGNISGDVNGIQAAPFLNVGMKVNGIQVGLINYSDSIKGLTIGMLNIVRHGLHKFELAYNELGMVSLTFKTASYGFHNNFYAAIEANQGRKEWGVGYGFGTLLFGRRRVQLGLNANSIQLSQNGKFYNGVNLLNRASVSLGFDLFKGVDIFFSPSYNLLIREPQAIDLETASFEIAPFRFGAQPFNDPDALIQSWIGFEAGIRF